MPQVTRGTDKSTPAAEMGYVSHVSNEPMIDGENGTASTAERRPDGYDMFSVDELLAADLGITDKMAAGWTPCWIRDDRWWGKRVSGNRFTQWRRDNPGGIMVTKDNEPYSMGEDIVLCLRPPETQAAHDRAWAEKETSFFKEMEADRKDDDFPDDAERKRKLGKHNSQLHQQAGMIGPHSRTEGMTLEEAYRHQFHRMSDEQMNSAIDQEETRFARGGRQSVNMEEAPPDRSGSKGTTYSIPANVRPRNLAKT